MSNEMAETGRLNTPATIISADFILPSQLISRKAAKLNVIKENL